MSEVTLYGPCRYETLSRNTHKVACLVPGRPLMNSCLHSRTTRPARVQELPTKKKPRFSRVLRQKGT